LRTCTIITTTPNALMRGIHNRMPAILRREDEELWLNDSITATSELLSLLRPYPDEALRAQPVSAAVNSPVFDSPQCIEFIVDEDGEKGT
jgi:putative SOS response-associated peptidase YedK